MVKVICHNLMYIEENNRRDGIINMKNKTTKKIIIIIFILLLLFFTIIIILKNQIDKIGGIANISNKTINTLDENNLEDDSDDETEGDILEDPDYEVEIDDFQMPAETEEEGLRDALYQDSPRVVTSTIYYSTVKNIIDTFLHDLGTMSKKKYINKTDLENISNADLRKKAYDRLSKNYIEKNEIDINNISEKMYFSYSEFDVNIEKMMQYAIKENKILRFAVRLNIQDDEETSKTNNFIVYLDYENQSYSIEPVGNGNIENVKLDSEISKIEKNVNNTYLYIDEEV